MFKQIKIPVREFYCELKHRPPSDRTGEQEQLIETLVLEVPRLRNSDMERQWAIAQLWNKLHEPEFIEKNINQVFCDFTHNFAVNTSLWFITRLPPVKRGSSKHAQLKLLADETD